MAKAEIKFDKGIPLPKIVGQGGRSIFADMEVGDSFIATESQANAVWTYGKSRGWKTSQRRQPNGKLRVWRLK